MTYTIFPIAVIITALAIILYLLTRKEIALPGIRGLKPYYSELVGGRFDLVNFTYPLVKIALYDEFMTINNLKPIILKWVDISSVETTISPLTKGIRILHARDDLPELIVIWSRNPNNLMRLLQEKL